MLFIFKHKSNQKQEKQNSKQDKIAEGIVKRCIIVQNEASKVLQDRFEMLSISRKRFVVVVFCVTSFGCSVYLMLRSFDKHTDNAFLITTISVPKQAGSELHSSQASNGVTKAELEKIIKFRDYLDSLAKSESGKRILDSIVTNRYGLIESHTILEGMYHLQSSNK